MTDLTDLTDLIAPADLTDPTDPIPPADLTELRHRVAGPVLAADDPAVPAEVATFNLATTHRPAVVVGATSAADIAAAVGWAVAHDLPVAVQATGHGAVRPVEDAVLVTTTRMRDVRVDPAGRTATVGAGARWADVIEAAAPHGLAPVSGSSSRVGVVGYCVGGGMGPLSRQYGFGADQVLGIELVTADGVVRWLDEHSEPDLFWAVRGGKGNFGVVTTMRVALLPVATIFGGAVVFDGGSARQVLHSFRTWAPTLPDRSSTSLALLNLPPAKHLPPSMRGRYVVMLRFAHNGSDAEGRELLAPMLDAGEVLVDGVAAIPYAESDSIHQDPTEPMPIWERASLLRELSADAVDRLLDAAGPESGAPLAMVELRLMGGALGRQPRVPNAVSGREGAFSLLVLGVLAPGAPGVPEAGLRVIGRMQPWSTGTTVVNWLGDASPDEVARAWRPEVHARLMAVKRRVDPCDVFRFGHALGR